MSRMFRYILRHDTGMAPCIDDGWITLATCKPRVRKGVRPGDWVAGFVPKPHPRGLLIYAGRVLEVLDVGSYEKAHRGRSDAIYRRKKDGSFKRLLPKYHSKPGQIRKDLSAPVLVFDESTTWYFGDRPQALPEGLLHLSAAGRPDRVSGASDKDINAFEEWLRANWAPGVHGSPRDFEVKHRHASGCKILPARTVTCGDRSE